MTGSKYKEFETELAALFDKAQVSTSVNAFSTNFSDYCAKSKQLMLSNKGSKRARKTVKERWKQVKSI